MAGIKALELRKKKKKLHIWLVYVQTAAFVLRRVCTRLLQGK